MLTFSCLLSIAAESSMSMKPPRLVPLMLWPLPSDGGRCKESKRPLNVPVHEACNFEVNVQVKWVWFVGTAGSA
jgi:hypothetical protein